MKGEKKHIVKYYLLFNIVEKSSILRWLIVTIEASLYKRGFWLGSWMEKYVIYERLEFEEIEVKVFCCNLVIYLIPS